MPNIRIYDLAKQLDVENKEVVSTLVKLGIKDKTASSSIEKGVAEKVIKKFKKAAQAKTAKKPVKTGGGTKPATGGAKAKKAAKPVKPAVSRPKTMKAIKVVKVKKPAQPSLIPPKAKGADAGLKANGKTGEAPDVEKIAQQKARSNMKKAFQAIRKIDSKKFQPAFKKHGRGGRGGPRPQKSQAEVTAPRKKSLKIQEGATIKEFAEVIGIKLQMVIKKFMDMGYMPTINQAIDLDAAILVADSFGTKLDVEPLDDETAIEDAPEDMAKMVHRPPIVTVMGHVDHGKTSLLDAIRETSVTASEAGGITQHIGAYKVPIKEHEIVFLDTPGHEAFTALRARGAKVTDIVVLVVAADDGVKPQTVEAIDHAKAAKVPIIVAINKIDKPEANPEKVKQELSEYEIMPEDWGGKNIFVEISAKQHTGIENLLEMLLLQAEIMELKANPDRAARGIVIEARLSKGRGPVATVLVQTGTLKVGDAFVSGVNSGRVRELLNDAGKKIKSAGPSTPAQVIGFSDVPTAGDAYAAVEDEKKARQIAMARANKLKARATSKMAKMSLEELYEKIKEGQAKDLNLIVKGDVHGSIEAISDALIKIIHSEVKINIIHSAVGGINESDVMLAAASNAVIMGFNVRPDTGATQAADREGVEMKLYNVIYEAIDDVKKALEGLLEPTLKEKVLGRAEVRQTFQASKIGTIAGCTVIEGHMSRASEGLRIIRDNIVVYEGKMGSLKRFKEDVKEVQTGYECGILVENFNDIKVGDIIENFIIEKIAAKL